MRCQQDRLYAAERLIDNGPVFRTTAVVQTWLDDLREAWWWEKWIPNVLKVEIGRGNPGKGVAGVGWFDSDANAGRLEFAHGVELNERRVVHELSHVIADARKNSHSHDPWFARIYLELTYLIRGRQSYQDLMTAFIAYDIDFDAEGLALR